MAGKKEKKAKQGEKKPSLLPKVIGGIKLPKDARRQLTVLAKHPVIADLIAAGLVALAQRIKGDGAAPAASEPAATPAPEAKPAAAQAEPQADAAPAKPAVKRIRKTVAASTEPADIAAPATPTPAPRTRKPRATSAAKTAPAAAPAPAEPAVAKPAKASKAPPPRRTRKATDTTAKPRTRRTSPKTEN